MIEFPRKTKLFRGEFQAGPFASVFLLFLIFFTFTTAIVYLPGLPLKLEESGLRLQPGQVDRVEVTAPREIRFHSEVYRDFSSFETRLRQETATNARTRLLVVHAQPEADEETPRRIAQLAQDLKLMVDLPGVKLSLPVSDSLVVVTNPTLVVLVNMAGEIFFQSQLVTDDRLQSRLASAAREMARPPALLLVADRAVNYDTIARVGSIARAAGIEQVILSTRPPLFGNSAAP